MAITSLTRNSIQNPNKYTDLLAGNSVYEVSSLVPIQTVRAASTVVDLSFTSIPQGYQDLFLVMNVRSDNASSLPAFSVYVNSTGLANWSQTTLYGNGSSAGSLRTTTSTPTYGLQWQPGYGIAGASATAGVYSSVVVHILNYANTSTYKTAIGRSASDLNGSGMTVLIAGNWANTSAITSIQTGTQGNFVAGSTATLYGVKAVGQ